MVRQLMEIAAGSEVRSITHLEFVAKLATNYNRTWLASTCTTGISTIIVQLSTCIRRTILFGTAVQLHSCTAVYTAMRLMLCAPPSMSTSLEVPTAVGT